MYRRSFTEDALLAAGHDVVRSIDELGGGADDTAVLKFARMHERIVLTYKNADFKLLGEANPAHSGILLLYEDNKPTDMNNADIVGALVNVAATYPDGIVGQTVVLNGYRW